MGDPSSMPRHLKKPLEEFQLAKHFLAFDTIYRHYISANITGGGFRGFNCSGYWPAILPVPTVLHLALNSPCHLPLLSKIFVTVILEIQIHFPNVTPGGRQRRGMHAAHPQPYMLNIQNSNANRLMLSKTRPRHSWKVISIGLLPVEIGGGIQIKAVPTVDSIQNMQTMA